MDCEYCQKTDIKQSHPRRCEAYRIYIKETLTDEFLVEEYISKAQSLPQIAKNTDISISTIHRRLKELNLNRSVKESCYVPGKQEQREATMIARTGSKHNFCKENPSRIAWEKRLLESEGITNVFQREDVKNKTRITLLEKYGVESVEVLSRKGRCAYSALHKEVVEYLIDNFVDFKIEKKIFKPEGLYYSFDIFVEPNLLIEVNGDYWHGNPSIYKATDIILKGSSKELVVEAKWISDAKKIQTAKDQGFEVLVLWESDLKHSKALKELLNAPAIKNQIDQKDSSKGSL